ncbi:MAG: AAA family ATPase [Rhodospirillales bacterium]|nr:AAA family ATPase [Rhodospirillales bacterium]
MHVVAMVARKGGVGKTTLAGHLAVEAERAGDGPVAVVDTDPQGSLTDWWNVRSAPTPAFVQTTLDRLEQDLDQLRGLGTKMVIIDSPSALTGAISNVVKVADLVVIPTRPSPHDVRALSATVELVEHLGKPLVFVINAAVPRTRITTETISLISAYGPMAPTSIGHRIDFASSMIDGRTVMELPGRSKSSSEISELWAYVRGRVKGNFQPRQLPTLSASADVIDLFGLNDARTG